MAKTKQEEALAAIERFRDAHPDIDLRIDASLRLGATHFLEKPVDLHTIAALFEANGEPALIAWDGVGARW